MGVKLRASSISKLRLCTDIAINEISLNVIYDRLGVTIRIPVLISSKTRWNHLVFTLAINAFGGWLFSLYENTKNTSSHKIKKLKKKNASRL